VPLQPGNDFKRFLQLLLVAIGPSCGQLPVMSTASWIAASASSRRLWSPSRPDRLFSELARSGRNAAGRAAADPRRMVTASWIAASASYDRPRSPSRSDRLFSERARSGWNARGGRRAGRRGPWMSGRASAVRSAGPPRTSAAKIFLVDVVIFTSVHPQSPAARAAVALLAGAGTYVVRADLMPEESEGGDHARAPGRCHSHG
jgi:hypothetical protein